MVIKHRLRWYHFLKRGLKLLLSETSNLSTKKLIKMITYYISLKSSRKCYSMVMFSENSNCTNIILIIVLFVFEYE